MSCIFCDILDGTRDGHIVYEDNDHIAFLDKYPIDDGHTLVIPRKHHEKITGQPRTHASIHANHVFLKIEQVCPS